MVILVEPQKTRKLIGMQTIKTDHEVAYGHGDPWELD
jgi:hypothetical protein